MRPALAPLASEKLRAQNYRLWEFTLAAKTESLEERLISLESRLAHNQRMAEDLSDLVIRQTQTLDVLTKQVERLRSRILELESDWPAEDDKPPPHY